MKRRWPLLPLCLVWFAVRSSAQESPSAARHRLLVDCQDGPVVVVDGTEQPAAGLAVAWTLRPNHRRAPVDWSLYDEKGSYDLLQRFPVDFERSSTGDYRLSNGVLDLKRKVFTPLPSRAPYFPTKNHGSLEADWSDEARGVRYGVIANNGGGHAFEYTLELWLVRIDAQGTYFTELTSAADKAVRAYLHKRDPKDAGRYVWKCDLQNDSFQGQKLSVHFDAETALGQDTDDGVVHFALPSGGVVGTTKQ